MEDFYYYSSVPADKAVERMFMGFGVFLIGLIAVLGVYLLLCYIFESVGLYHMSKNRGIRHAWWSWILIMRWNIIGEPDNDEILFGKDMIFKRAAFWLPVLSAASLMICDSVHQLSAAVCGLDVRSKRVVASVQDLRSEALCIIYGLEHNPGHQDSSFSQSRTKRPTIRSIRTRSIRTTTKTSGKSKMPSIRRTRKSIRKVKDQEAEIEKTYQDAIDKEGVTDEEKEAARKDKEKALKDLHERARMAKEDNAKTAHDFEKSC